MRRMQAMAAGLIGVTVIVAPALGSIVVTQGTSAPTYTDFTLDFDEPGGPTGVVDPGAWSVSHGITELQAGDGVPQVDDWTGIFGPWVGTANSFYGNFGVFMTLDTDVTEMSLQVWDPSGPPGPFGGGLYVFLFDDGVEVSSTEHTPAWGDVGDEWFDITTDGGDVFDEVRILGFGFSPTTFVDNLSWNVIPEPTSLALFGLVGVAALRRRRA